MLFSKNTLKTLKGYDTPPYLENFLMKLDTNENILGPSPKVIEAIRNITEEEIKFYPAYGELVEELAIFNKLTSKQVLPTNGCDEALNYIFDTFMSPDDEVITVKPSFAMPKIYANAIGCVYNELDYDEKWVFPTEKLINKITPQTKLIILTTPNNPTGDAISRENVLKILEKSKHCYVLIDETYTHYTEESFTDLIEEYPNVIITKSFSKDFALAGLRVGYILAVPEIINEIKKIICPFSVNTIAVKAALAALRDKEYFEKIKKEVITSRNLLYNGLKSLAKTVYDGKANFLVADFADKADFYYTRLLNAGIKIKNFAGHPELNGCLRISIPTIEQTKIILDILNEERALLVFDIDGVIVDTRQSYRMAIKNTFEYFANKSIDFSEIQEAKNLGGLNNDWDLTEYLLKNEGLNIDKNIIIDKFQEFYIGSDFNGLILNESILIQPEKLNELSKEYDMAVFTGRPKDEAEFVLKRWNLYNIFSNIITMDDIPLEKGKPDSFGLEVIKSKTVNKEILYFGDTSDDMISAVGAKVKGIGILPPQDKTQELTDKMLEKGAFAVLQETDEIVDFLGAKHYEMQRS
ncbi:MAG: histidinol-phosphate transaminase [bacterium]